MTYASKYRLYAGAQAPNGTHELIVTDQDGTIVSVIDEALFGVPFGRFRPQLDRVIVSDGDAVFLLDATDVPDADQWLAALDAADVTRYLAASPTRTAPELADMLAGLD